MAPALLTAQDCEGQVHLVIGSNPLASIRCKRAIEVGAIPKIVAPADASIHYALQDLIDSGRVEWLKKAFEDDDVTSQGREEVARVVDAVFVTSNGKSVASTHISQLCRRMRIPVNVVDAPNLCTFTLLSTHSDGPLQIGITTSGKGCSLASRIRREIASTLPPKFGDAVERLGMVRRRIWEEDHKSHDIDENVAEHEDEEAPAQRPNFNRFISDDDLAALKTRRMRWLSQICEYWPLKRLASITDTDIESIMASYSRSHDQTSPSSNGKISHDTFSKPQIILAGSGPGSPALLTIATHRAIKTASVIIADKLVPGPVLDLIPRRTTVHIARKFPGNADAAQEELLELGLAALEKGQTVLRLKQGDPYIYGRGAEEYAFFRGKGYTPVVLPGITSALSAPLFAAIPNTHRGVADQVLICTGSGRKGEMPKPPSYVASKTVIFLMALNRITKLVDALTGAVETADPSDESRETKPWPRETPCAVIERASCPDQRVIRTTLQHVCEAIEQEGSRPPGLLVVGWSCEVLIDMKGKGKWITEDGFSGFNDLDMNVDEFLEERGGHSPLPKIGGI